MLFQIIYWITIGLILFGILIFGVSFTQSLINKVPYLPSRKKNVQIMLDQITPSKNSKIYDLGCGDGKILFQIESKFGIPGIGYELSPLPYLISQLKTLLFKYKTKIYFQNLFNANLNNADYIFIYLTPSIIQKVSNKILKECRLNTVIISNTFKVPNLKLIKTIDGTNNTKIYVYKI